MRVFVYSRLLKRSEMLNTRASLALVCATLAACGTVGRTSTICYQCGGLSGLGNLSATFTYCGLPFKDNSSSPLPTVQCEGVCVTQVVYYYYGRKCKIFNYCPALDFLALQRTDVVKEVKLLDCVNLVLRFDDDYNCAAVCSLEPYENLEQVFGA